MDHFKSIGRPVPPLTSAAEHYLDVVTDASKDSSLLAELASAADERSLSLAAVRSALGGGKAGGKAGGGGWGEVRKPGLMAQAAALLWRANLNNRRHPAFFRAMLSRSIAMAVRAARLVIPLSPPPSRLPARA